MGLERILTLIALVIASLLTLIFTLDLALGIPFSRANIILDVLFIIAGGFIIWQSLDTYREFA